MLKNKRVILYVTCLCMVILPGSLYAIGYGGYISGGGGVSTYRAGDSNSSVEYGLGGGFLLDTAVGLNEKFNYRLGVGYENAMKSGYSFFDIWSIHKIAVTNTFGYAFYRSKYLRVWMGPQIELAGRFIRIQNSTRDVYRHAIINGVPPLSVKNLSIDYSVFSFGFGAILGININTDTPLSIGFEIGFNACLGIGPFNEKKSDYVITSDFILPSQLSSKSRDVIFAKADAITRISFIYRVGETFISEMPNEVDVKLQNVD